MTVEERRERLSAYSRWAWCGGAVVNVRGKVCTALWISSLLPLVLYNLTLVEITG